MKLSPVFAFFPLVMLLVGCDELGSCCAGVTGPPLSSVGGLYAVSDVSLDSLTFAHSGVQDLLMDINRDTGTVRVRYARDGKSVEEFWTITETQSKFPTP